MAGNKNVYGDRINTPVGRVSYPHVFKKVAQMDPSKPPRYECSLLIPKTTDVSALKAAMEKVAQEAFGSRFKGLDKLKNNPLRDGDDTDRAENKGHWIIKANSSKRPGVIGPDKIAIEEDDESGFYGGCWGRLNVTPGSYDVSGSWGVTLYLNACQKARDGERFGGGGTNAEDVFEEFESDIQDDVNF